VKHLQIFIIIFVILNNSCKEDFSKEENYSFIKNYKKCFDENEQFESIKSEVFDENLNELKIEEAFEILPYCGNIDDPFSYNLKNENGGMVLGSYGDSNQESILYSMNFQFEKSYSLYTDSIFIYNIDNKNSYCHKILNPTKNKEITSSLKLYNNKLFYTTIIRTFGEKLYTVEPAWSTDFDLEYKIKNYNPPSSTYFGHVLTSRGQVISSINDDIIFYINKDEILWSVKAEDLGEDVHKIFTGPLITEYVNNNPQQLKSLVQMKDKTIKKLILNNCGEGEVFDLDFDLKLSYVLAYIEYEEITLIAYSDADTKFDIDKYNFIVFDKEKNVVIRENDCLDIISLDNEEFLCSKYIDNDLILVFFDKNFNKSQINMGSYIHKDHANIIAASNNIVIINDTKSNPKTIELTFLNYKTQTKEKYSTSNFKKPPRFEDTNAEFNNKPILTKDGLLVLDSFGSIKALKTNLKGLSSSKFPRGLLLK
jgi:hypothetical protein